MMTKEQRKEALKKAREAKAKRLNQRIEEALKPVGQPAQEALQEEPTVEHIEVKKKATTPWKPPRVLDLPASLKKPGMKPRWVNKNQANMAKKRAYGWIVVKVPPEAKQDLAMTLQDSVGLDGTIQMRELILMWIPEETAQAIRDYNADRATRAFKEQKTQLKQEIIRQGSVAPVYGNYEEDKEFVRR